MLRYFFIAKRIKRAKCIKRAKRNIGSARGAVKRTGSAQALRGLPQNAGSAQALRELPQNVQTANDHIHLPRLYSLRQLAVNYNNTPKKKLPNISFLNSSFYSFSYTYSSSFFISFIKGLIFFNYYIITLL